MSVVSNELRTRTTWCSWSAADARCARQPAPWSWRTGVLASSAPAEDLERFRKILDADRWLTGVTSSGDVESSKPESDIFDVAIATCGLDAATTIAVGDTVWDAEAADRAGITFVGVETGGTTTADLRSAGAAAAYPDLPALLEHLDRGPFAPLLVLTDGG